MQTEVLRPRLLRPQELTATTYTEFPTRAQLELQTTILIKLLQTTMPRELATTQAEPLQTAMPQELATMQAKLLLATMPQE